MKLETEFDENGWKIVVEKFKDGRIKISQRSKDTRIHMMHKPMQLNLNKDNFKKMMKLIKEINKC